MTEKPIDEIADIIEEMPSDEAADVIEANLAGALTRPLYEWPKAAKGAVKAIAKGDWAKALEEAEPGSWSARWTELLSDRGHRPLHVGAGMIIGALSALAWGAG